jgi:hypothetical protein
MPRLLPLGLLILMALVLGSSCFIDNRPRRARSCPPSYHWNGDRCVHNSARGKGHYKQKKHKKHKNKKHRRR